MGGDEFVLIAYCVGSAPARCGALAEELLCG
jgi:hypothetical protein